MRALLGVMLLSLLSHGCAPTTPAMMAPQSPRPAASPSHVEVARVEPPPGHRSLLVAYPRTACAGSARTVLIDAEGKYFGAVAPGEATLLIIPLSIGTLFAVSSVEIHAPMGTRFVFEEVDVSRVPDALLLEGIRASARQCSTSGHYANAEAVTKREIEDRLAEEEITWMAPRPREGQAWIEAHRPRVDEILGRKPIVRPVVVQRSGRP